MDIIDTVVIGAGVIGLACAAALAQSGRTVLILEAKDSIGTGISARNSEVIHAGIYYPYGSLKAHACVRGNALLQQYAQDHGIPYHMIGKLIVATNAGEEETLATIQSKAAHNGVTDLRQMSANEVKNLEPSLKCTAALLSPSTGIIDTHAYMLSLCGKAEACGAMLARRCPVLSGESIDQGTLLHLGDSDHSTIIARHVIIAGGLSAPNIARTLGLQNIPQTYLCKGHYFSLTGGTPFSRLIYPVPVSGGLGIHYTLDMAGRGRFGPDVAWINEENYDVATERRINFAAAIQRYWPDCRAENLHPAYAGIRPKICPPGAPDADFLIMDETKHGAKGIIALLGIESPGITASLALAEMIRTALAAQS